MIFYWELFLFLVAVVRGAEVLAILSNRLVDTGSTSIASNSESPILADTVSLSLTILVRSNLSVGNHTVNIVVRRVPNVLGLTNSDALCSGLDNFKDNRDSRESVGGKISNSEVVSLSGDGSVSHDGHPFGWCVLASINTTLVHVSLHVKYLHEKTTK